VAKENRRVKYTKMVLMESLLKLLKDKPINKITVTELCELADINRGTFYTHYYDVYDLLEQIENDLYEKISTEILSTLKKIGHKGFMTGIFQVIADNKDLCMVLFSEYGNRDFIVKIIDITKESTIQNWKSLIAAPKNNLEYVYTFMSNGIVGILQHWVQGGLKESVKELSILVERLNSSILNSINEQDV